MEKITRFGGKCEKTFQFCKGGCFPESVATTTASQVACLDTAHPAALRIRPVGGVIADRLGGTKATQIISVLMVASAPSVACNMKLAYQSATPEEHFLPFFLLFLLLFPGSGIGNGSTFRTIAMVFDKEQEGPVLGWTSAVAAYGAFNIPQVFGGQIRATTPVYGLFGFTPFISPVCS